MSNKLDEMLNEVQYKTGKKLEEIAMELGYSRPYLSRMRKTGSEPVERKIAEVYKELFTPVSNGISALEALLSVVASRVSELLSDKSGRSSLIEFERMKKDAQDLGKMNSGNAS